MDLQVLEYESDNFYLMNPIAARTQDTNFLW